MNKFFFSNFTQKVCTTELDKNVNVFFLQFLPKKFVPH